ncbi:unnamed protein product [Brachionus calyciflorus]|uniref:Fork-head domain-containing protein n=1 Tax=Brachionus calyciflorus TaxID=104777 RepID=A0A813UF97_9BILA|nr:unnamed protein product [Brachionus calyciflorus]
MTTNTNPTDSFYQAAFTSNFATTPGFFLDNNQLLSLSYQSPYGHENSESNKKQKLSDNDCHESDTKRQKIADTREFNYFSSQPPPPPPPPLSLGSNSSPSSNESSSPNYPLNQQYQFNYTDYQKPFPTIIQTTVIDDLNRIDNVYIKKSKRDPIAEYDSELAESIEYELGLKKQNGPRKNSWGNLSYAELITRAIESSAEQRLTLSQIYDWIIKYVPYFKEKFDRTSSAGWKNSIRHNLSLHNRFIRVQNESSGKSSWWMINPDVSKYAINPTADNQEDFLMDNFKEKIDNNNKIKSDKNKTKKTHPNDTIFDEKTDKLLKKPSNKSKNVKKGKSVKKSDTAIKTVKPDLSTLDSPISTSPSNFSNQNILRSALQKPSNSPPTPTATPNSLNYRNFNADFYQNPIGYSTVEYSYQTNGLNNNSNNNNTANSKNSQFYNYQCLSNNQAYSAKSSYMMPPVTSGYFNPNYQKISNGVSSPVSTASTTSTSSTPYDLSSNNRINNSTTNNNNNNNKPNQPSLPGTPTSLLSTNSSVISTNLNNTNAYDDFSELFKAQMHNTSQNSYAYNNQSHQMTNVTNNVTPIGCFYGN